jgi:hypothetical protein
MLRTAFSTCWTTRLAGLGLSPGEQPHNESVSLHAAAAPVFVERQSQHALHVMQGFCSKASAHGRVCSMLLQHMECFRSMLLQGLCALTPTGAITRQDRTAMTLACEALNLPVCARRVVKARG